MLNNNTGMFYPEAMRNLPNWVLWKLEPNKDGRMTKVPYSALYDGRASSTNPKTWTTFERVCSKVREQPGTYNGLGFMLFPTDKIVFIDLDHCIKNGNLNDFSVGVINLIGKDTYYELSQSGTGLHVFCFGTLPENIHTKTIEMYSSARFCAMTGKTLSKCELSDKTAAVIQLYEKNKRYDISKPHKTVPDNTLRLSDLKIIEYASKNEHTGDKFQKLMSGDFSDYPSQSEADIELCRLLAFWADRDPDTIERIFSSSGLCRSKWTKRPKYREQTITKACDSIEECFSEYIARKDSENAPYLEAVREMIKEEEARNADKK